MIRPLRVPWRWWRRIVQLVALAAFLWLFRRTEYTGPDTLPAGGWENLFFRLDPLAGASAMVAARQLLSLFWPALIVLALSVVLGRFFCGWVCPLGTLLDWFAWLIRPVARWTGRAALAAYRTGRRWPPLRPVVRGLRLGRYVLLLLVLGGAVLALPLVGFVDPFALLTRGLTFWLDPAFYRGAEAGFGWAGQRWGPEAVQAVQRFFDRHLLPYRANVFHLAGVSALILAVIFALEFLARRFWCRWLCPLGAIYGVLGRFSFLKRRPTRVCKDCSTCATVCRMGAMDEQAGLSPESCNLCMDCVDACPKGIVRFTWRQAKAPSAGPDLSRRGLLAAAAAGLVLPACAKGAQLLGRGAADPLLLRPPGAADEQTFLDLCIRCGLCMKVCPTNVLQPTVLQAGVEGMFSPHLVPRQVFEQSYCEYNCNLCGQVCPSGAIPRLSIDQKHRRPVGKAYFDHGRCLPWAQKTPCIRCEEMCPLPEKAVKIRRAFTITDAAGQQVEIQQPYVDRELCIGCGICQSNCPLDGPAGIRVRRPDAPDPGTEFLDRPAPATRTTEH